MGHIPSSMMKVVIDFVETSSLSVVTVHRQRTSPLSTAPQSISLFRYAKDDDPDNPEDYLAPDIEPPSVFGNLVPVIVAEHNLVSDVSTSQVAEELAKEDERSDCEEGNLGCKKG